MSQWPGPLEEILNQKDTGIRFSVIDKGIAGTNTSAIVSGLEDNLDKYNPDMVITMMGINDDILAMPYEDIPAEKTVPFFNSFRIYKLIKSLKLHIINKAEEIGIYKLREDKEGLIKTNDSTRSSKFKEQEEIFKKAIEVNPEDERGYIELAWYYKDAGELTKAGEMFKNAIELNPENEEGYIHLGWYYKDAGELTKAGEMFKKTIELSPKNEEGYIGLGWYYKDAGELTKAEEMFKKAIELNPEDERGYIELGWYYRIIGEYTKAEEIFKNNKAEEIFKEAIELNPEDEWGYIELGWYYRIIGEYTKAEEMFKKAIELNPEDYRFNATLAIFYRERGKYNLAEEYSKKAESLKMVSYNPVTYYNYQRFKEIVAKRGKSLVCVQYPMRSVEPLKEMFRNREGIIFVDNEKSFKQAVEKEGYDEYFTDMFGGDFGHCTEKGNKLLAENIANTILRRIYSIKE